MTTVPGTQHHLSSVAELDAPFTSAQPGHGRLGGFASGITLFLLLVLVAMLAGCGTGGYPGGGIGKLSASALTLDAGQSFPITATLAAGSPGVQWTLSGASCSGAACGTLSASSGAMITYTAPAGVTASFPVTLRAAIPGTSSASTVAITVNPDPVISGTPPPGVVGQSYSTTLTVAGGTPPLVWSLVSGTPPPGLTFNPATGVLSGTPTAMGTYSFTVQAIDASAVPYTVTAVETVKISTAIVLTGVTPSGTVGTPYGGLLTATGGTGTYTYAITAGSLPAGLTLNGTTGAITGTPTAAGTANFTAQAQDAAGNRASGNFSITVVNALALTAGTLPGGTVGVTYNATIGVMGGTAPYTCVFTAGTLPAGLTLGANCVVSGTPTAAGTSILTVRATDANGATVSGPESITIAPAPLAITTGSLPNGTVGIAYSSMIGVSGGTAPYTCTITGGTLQAGLMLGANCVVSGTPTMAGTANLTVKVIDSSNPTLSTTGPVSLTINPAGLAITTGTLPNGTVGVTYSSTIGVTGGTAPYSCAILAGTLQAGLTLGPNCLVSGTPTVAGTVNLTVRATDSSNPTLTTTGMVALTINQAGVVIAGGNPPPGTVGMTYTGLIPITGGTGPYTCKLNSGVLPAGLMLGANCIITGTPTMSGASPIVVGIVDSSNPPNTGSSPITITINPAPLLITTGTLPNGTVGVTYSSTIGVTGGTAPYSCSILAGTLQAGLALGPNCLVSGTPTVAGTVNLTVKATDASNPTLTTTGLVSLTINPAAVLIVAGNPPPGMIGIIYNGPIPITGGTGPYTCKLSSGVLPAGLTLGANCIITGTPTMGGATPIGVSITDSGNPPATGSGPVTITINAGPLAITTGTLPNGTVGVTYSSTIGITGGTAPYTCTITAGTLQAGLTLGPNCLVSGIPTVASTVVLTVKATDSSNPTLTTTGQVSLTIVPAPLAITTGTLPNGTVGVTYSSTIGVTGGTAPYTCTITAGTLQAGLTLGPNCLVSGTPTVASTVVLTVKATDSSNPALTTTGQVSLTIVPAPLAITTGTLPNGTVGVTYSSTIGITGGTAPYTCTITAGTLQAGLTLGPNCLVSGTPTVASTVVLTVKATDSSNPTLTTTGQVSLTIVPAPLAITTGTLPNGTVGVTYSSTIGITGGTAPYTCTITAGTLQAGLTLGPNCLVSGTPTVASTVVLTVKATDSSNPALTTTGQVSLTIVPAPLAITTGTLPNGTVGVTYSSTIGVIGGTAPYTCTITAGTLQAGLTLGPNCLVSGTPTVASTVVLTVKATDSSNPTLTTTGQVSLTIVAAPVLVISNPPNGTVGTPYTGSIPVTGGTGPYTCMLNGGTLPAGLTLHADCSITGTPTTPITSTLMVSVTDSGKPPTTSSGTVTLTINPAPMTLTLGNPPVATVGTPYTGLIPVTGGTAPYTCTLNSGVVPAGLTLTNCTLSGTPTVAGTTILNLTATDSANPKNTITGPVTVVVNPIPKLTFTGSLPNAVLNQPYSQTLAATGGVGPYTYATTAGALPPGVTLGANGVVSGTPTAVGAYSFTATATDAENPAQTASLPLILLVTYAPTPTDALLQGPYAFLFQGYDDTTAGLTAYQTATAGSFTANGTGVLSAGELDSNHQSSNPTGNTIASNQFLGTYTIGTDDRGMLTITTLNAAGTVAGTNTYAITVKAPVAPATTTASGSLIEFDNNQLAGTRGSGSFLQQTAASFATGLTGSYAFGVEGDTPCLPTCTVALTAGPVAAVGEFTVASGAITGQSDANIANQKIVNQPLTGSYAAADSNGRVQLSLTTAGTPAGLYPTDYAVYMVSANQAFIVSTDKHSAAILLAGSAQSQTLAVFANTSLSGSFIGYENSPTNPGLVGTTLNNVTNLSTATIFRATADAAGTCTVTSVDTGGTTALVNGLTGLGSGAPTVNALLGTYASTGSATCATAPNGRVVLNYPAPSGLLVSTLGLLGLPDVPPPARIVYLSGLERGYFLETGYAGLGQIEPQTGQPYSLASFSGTYVYLEVPASSAATTNTTGVITANGKGSATSTQDLNTGVGTINVLQLGVTGTYPYTAPDAVTGRFVYNTTLVVYEISPGRFVLVDTNALTTSPSVILLD